MGDSRTESVLGHLSRWLGSRSLPSDDGQLLERFVQERDEEAFAELVARHGPLVFGLCRRVLGNVQDAEDVFQASFLVLARKAAAIRKPQSLSCWLHGVAYRLALKARAQAERRRIHEQRAQVPRESEDANLSWREVRGLIDEELQRLPEKQRLPLVLCYLEGLTQDEAARRLGWPRGTLKRRLEAGRERLRLRLTRRGVTLGAGLFATALTESASKGAVSLPLRSATVRAGMQFVANNITALAGTPAALLAKGALQSMLTTKIKLGAMVILLLGCFVTAAGLTISPAPPEKQPENKAEPSTQARRAEDKVRKDRYGDPLPKGAKARLGTLRLRHQHMTTSAVFTRDGKTAIVGDSGGFIVYWDVATGREVRRLQRTPGQIYALAITHDGKTLASESGGQVSLWEVASGKLLSRARLDNTAIWQMLFTPDGKTLALRSQGNTIHLWDTVSNKKWHDLKGHMGNVSCMVLSPDGKTLASGSWEDPHIRLWDIATGKEKHHFVAHDKDEAVCTLSFSPDGKTLASTGNRASFAFFDANTGKRLRKVKDYHGGLNAITYAPDGKSLVGIDSTTVHVLDAASGKHLREFDAPPRIMAGLTISPDGKTLATFWGGAPTFDLWETASGKLLHPAPGHRFGITSLAFAADGKTLFTTAGIQDKGPFAWDTTTGEPRGPIGEVPFCSHGLALSPDGKLLAACGFRFLRLLDPASLKEVRSCVGHKEIVTSAAWSADGKLLVSSSPNDQTIRVWDPATGKQRRVIEAKQSAVGQLALSPDGTMAAASGASDNAIHLWATASGKELRRIAMPRGITPALAFNLDGTILACGGRTISLWDPLTGRQLRRWDAEASQLAFSSDGRTLVSSGIHDATIRLWETATGKERASFNGQRGGIWSLAISRDGRGVASGSTDTTILIWDATAGACPDAALSAAQLQSLWRDLKDADAGRAYRTLWRMALAPNHALPFLAERLRPVSPLDADRQQQVDRLVTALDSDEFTVRQHAEADLEKMGPSIEPALHKAVESKPTLEVRQRIEKVLEKLTSERPRLLRALEAIEHMNTPEGRRVVESLAKGAPRAWLTEQAAAIRRRWAETSGTSAER